jgi:hypothetical protein
VEFEFGFHRFRLHNKDNKVVTPTREEKTDYMYIRSLQESNLAGGIASVSSGKIRFRQYTLTHDKYFWTRPR